MSATPHHRAAIVSTRKGQRAFDAGLRGTCDVGDFDLGFSVEGDHLGLVVDAPTLGTLSMSLTVASDGTAQLASVHRTLGGVETALSVRGASQLQAEVARLRSELAVLTTERDEARDRAEVLQEERRDLAATLSEVRDASHAAREELREKIETLAGALDAQKAEHLRALELQEHLKADAAASAREADAAEQAMQAEKAALEAAQVTDREALAAAHAELAELGARSVQLEAEVETLRAGGSAESEALAAARSELADLSAERDSMSARAGGLQAELEAAQAELDAAKGDIDAQKEQLDAAQRDVDAARAELETARSETDAARAEVETAQRGADAVRADLDGARAEAEGLRAELATAQLDLETALSAQTDPALRRQVDALTAELAQERELRAAAEAQSTTTETTAPIAGLEEALAERDAALAQSTAETESLQAHIAELTQSLAEAQSALPEWQEALQRYEVALATEQQATEEARAVAQRLLSERDEARGVARTMHQRLTTSSRPAVAAAPPTGSPAEQVAALTEMLDQERATLARVRSERDEFRARFRAVAGASDFEGEPERDETKSYRFDHLKPTMPEMPAVSADPTTDPKTPTEQGWFDDGSGPVKKRE